ncbi:MAG: hypothetical protein JSS49_25260 [Planctomycetes bacterium]|nr:hypothetical protein [Planctomycetota bacterium]
MIGEEATAKLIDGLEALQIDYMVVGSFSTNFYGIPRSTHDADIVIQLNNSSLAELQSHLGREFKVDMQLTFETATGTRRNIVTFANSSFKIELFRLSMDPHDQQRFQRRQRVFVQQLDRYANVPTLEDVIVFKLRWAVEAGRSKDRQDIRDVIAVQRGRLDWEYVFRWATEHQTRVCLDEIVRSIPVDMLAANPYPGT